MAHNSALATDITINLANTWVAETSDCEGDPIDPNLVLSRSFTNTEDVPPPVKDPSAKVITFEEHNSKTSSTSDVHRTTPNLLPVPLH